MCTLGMFPSKTVVYASSETLPTSLFPFLSGFVGICRMFTYQETYQVFSPNFGKGIVKK